MGAIELSDLSVEQRKWEKIFNGLVHMLQTQQAQIAALAKERTFLEDCVRSQHERWVSDVRLHEGRISQMKGHLETQRMTGSLEQAKSNLLISLKRSEAFLDKLKLEHTESDLEDLKAWVGCLSHESSNPKDLSLRNSSDMREEEQRSTILEGEIRRLKHEYEKLATEKSSEVSALLAEKEFVWNQYRIMENDHMSKLKSTRSEVAKADETIKELLSRVEQLQSLNDEKDEAIAGLRKKVAEGEAETSKLNETIFRSSQELRLLKSSRSAPVTPVLNHSAAGAQRSCFGAKRSGRSTSNINIKKEFSSAQIPDSAKGTEKGSRKRKALVDSISASPKLFSSDFMVPKLKPYLR